MQLLVSYFFPVSIDYLHVLYLDQRTACGAPVCWSNYTTPAMDSLLVTTMYDYTFTQVWREGVCFCQIHCIFEQCLLTDFNSHTRSQPVTLFPKKQNFPGLICPSNILFLLGHKISHSPGFEFGSLDLQADVFPIESSLLDLDLKSEQQNDSQKCHFKCSC